MTRKTKTSVRDLSKPSHARAYLLSLEREGILSFDDDAKVSDLSDIDCVQLAEICFMKRHPSDTDTLQ